MEIEILLICGFFLVVMLLIFICDRNNNKRIIEQLSKDLKATMKKRKDKTYRDEWNKKIQQIYLDEKNKQIYMPNLHLKVLVGDYDKFSVSITNRVLKNMGIDTYVVPESQDVIDEIESGTVYDLIITNHVYGNGGSGEQVLEFVKSNKKNIPVIILTIDQNARHKYVYIEGFDEYINKILDENKVKQILPKVIKKLKFYKIK